MTVDAEKLIEQARLVPESRGNALVNALADEVERLTAENVSLREANLRRSLERDEARDDRDRLTAERDEARSEVARWEQRQVRPQEFIDRLLAAEAERDRLAAALREIAALRLREDTDLATATGEARMEMREIAAAALAAVAEEDA